MIIGINGSNIGSVGGINHIKHILIEFKNNKKDLNFKVNKIIVWCSERLFNKIKYLKSKGITIKKVKNNFYYNFLWKLFFLNYELKKNKCDVLFSLDGIVFRKYKKTVVFFQNLIPFNFQEMVNFGISFRSLKNFLTYIFYLISYRLADGFIILNNYGKNLIEKKLGKLKVYEIIPHGIDKDFWNLNKNSHVKKKIIHAVYISPIDFYKHQWNVIRAINEVNQNYDIKLKLHLVGSNSDKKAFYLMEDEMKKANLNSEIVFYHGNKNKKFIISLLKKTNIFIFASSCESFGLTLLEGMASGCAILCSKKSGLDVTSGKKAIYFNPVSSNSIKKAIIKFLNINSKKIKIKNHEIFKVASQYDWKITSIKTFNFINEIFLKKTKYKKIKKNKIFALDYLKRGYLSNIYIFSYIINFFTPMYIFYLLYFFEKNKEITVDYAVFLSIGSFVTQFFSTNLRNLIIADSSKVLVYSGLIFRFLLTLILLFILIKISHITYFIFDAVLLSALLVFSTWIREIAIANSENNKNTLIEIISQIFNIFIVPICSILFILNKDVFFIKSLAFFVFFETLLRTGFILKNRLKDGVINFKNYLYFYKNILSYAFLSGVFLSVLNLIIRVTIDNNYETIFAANLMFYFSLATFPGSLITGVLGVSYLKKEKSYPLYFTLLIFAYLVFCIISIILISFDITDTVNKSIVLALIAGFISVFSQSIRQLNIINKFKRIRTFKRDILYVFFSIILLFIFIRYFKIYIDFYIFFTILISLFFYLSYHKSTRE
jgi:glycosyltransferase involved in cell wall biosynthesis